MGRRLHPPGFPRRAAPGRPLPADRATAMSTPRLQHPLDRFLDEPQRALETVFGNPPAARANQAGDTTEVALVAADSGNAQNRKAVLKGPSAAERVELGDRRVHKK